MSAHTRKLPTSDQIEVAILGPTKKTFFIPRKASSKLLGFIKMLQETEEDDSIPADEAFKDLDQKYGKIGVTLQGFRHRDGLTQAVLAQKLGIQQAHVSQMEHSKRPIGKKLAQKLAKIFNTSYRLFL